jgi:hypothetical protein
MSDDLNTEVVEVAAAPEAPVVLKPFVRKPLDTLDKVKIQKNVQRASLKGKGKVMQVFMASQTLIATKTLVDEIRDLRKERGYAPLQDDPEFISTWEEIDAASHRNDALEVLRLALGENMRLTTEINAHRRALGLNLMKVYQP